ncbi:MAG: ComF family protein [Holosporales bacterium]|jgi:ComF family protein|nr:ComF family protein [Holosporales bacterium]
MKILWQLVDWIWPNECRLCGGIIDKGAVFCSSCFTDITFIDQPICELCGRLLPFWIGDKVICESCVKMPPLFDACRSLFMYNYSSRKIIMKIKKNANADIAKLCCKMLAVKYQDILKNADLILPVPSHWTRILKRGYNPADLIACSLSKILEVPVGCLLKRIRKTQYQKNKTINERVENVIGAFSCVGDLSGQTVILVDDVMTTGSTMNECSKVLRFCNAMKVVCIAVASTRGAIS